MAGLLGGTCGGKLAQPFFLSEVFPAQSIKNHHYGNCDNGDLLF